MKSTRHAAGRLRRRGFVLITMLCSLVVLLAFLGLAIDSAYLEYVKTKMQTAADAAAVGGVQELRAADISGVLAAARADAALNGFTHGSGGVTVTVNSPPSTGYSTSDPTAVEVIVSQRVPTFFMGVVGATGTGLQARAVAHLGNGDSCVQALDPSASGAFSISGSASLQTACGIVVTSSNSAAFSASGSAEISGTSILVHGGASVSGSARVSPSPVTGAPAAADALSYLAAPPVGACDYSNVSVSNASSVTLPPGVYCHGITVSGSAHVLFSPGGLFVMKGGGLSISGNSTVTGTGVTIYNTAATGYSYGAISISGNSDVTLSAPTTGSLSGILIFQDRNVVSGASNTFSGSSTLSLTGALYFPTTHVDYSGDSSGANPYSILVAKTITFTGNTTIHNDYSSLPGGSPIKSGAQISE